MSFKSFCRSMKRVVCKPIKKICSRLSRSSRTVVPAHESVEMVSAKAEMVIITSTALILYKAPIAIHQQQQPRHQMLPEVLQQEASGSGSFIDLTKKFQEASEIFSEMKRLARCYDAEEEPTFVSKVFPPATPSAINMLAPIQPSFRLVMLLDLGVNIPRSLLNLKLPSLQLIKYVPPKVYLAGRSQEMQEAENFLNVCGPGYSTELAQIDEKVQSAYQQFSTLSIIASLSLPILSL